MRNSVRAVTLHTALSAVVCLIVLTSVSGVAVSRDITLDQALDIALNRTARGGIINGNLDVAEQTYHARQINFYVPEVSLNGSLPSYQSNQSYDFFYGNTGKSLIKTNDLGLSSFIQLKQSLITGGDFTVQANLTADKSKYPNTQTLGEFVNERNRKGYFNFNYVQPLLKPSDAKNDLNNKRDDFELARFTKLEDQGNLKKDVITAYVGVLQTDLRRELAEASYESAKLNAENDSAMLKDGIISDDKWLETSSKRLDAELQRFDMDNQVTEMHRQLATVLDLDASEEFNLSEPAVANVVDDALRANVKQNWDKTLAVKRAEYQYRKAKRAAEYAAGSHGLSGNLSANYSFGRGTVKVEGAPDDNINTNSWNIGLNFTYPIWDGGASSASVKASELQAESARLEYEKAQKSARAELEALTNKLDVSYRKLDIIRQQITIAENKVEIAKGRLANGEISELTFLDARIFYLQTKDKFFDELKNFLLNKIDLEVKLNG